MRLLGFQITKANAGTLAPPTDSRGGWVGWIRESFSGAWQRNAEELSPDECGANFAEWACRTLIASDISKLRVRLVQQKGDVWQETQSPAFSPVLRKPNGFQNRIQFFESWVLSKLQRGNTYALKARDGRGIVTALYVLNPDRVQPLVSEDGQVFYQLSKDNLAGLEEAQVIVPAREIIHDRFNCLYHPLVGIAPVYASALASTLGTNIQRTAARSARNGVRIGGILVAPGKINPEDASRLKETWETRYSGPEGAGRIAVLGDGIKFEKLTMTAEEAQLIEQLKYTAEIVCAAYHVPPYKIGGTMPTYANIQSLNVEYYSQCLQKHIEDIELCLDEGLGIGEGVPVKTDKGPVTYGTEFDVDNLLRMDSATQITMLKDGVSAAIYAPNEARAKVGLGAVEGGASPLMQVQNYSLAALAKRDSQEDPFAKAGQADGPPQQSQDQQDQAAAEKAAAAAHYLRKELSGLAA
jgi:HK97 family phage portal protein